MTDSKQKTSEHEVDQTNESATTEIAPEPEDSTGEAVRSPEFQELASEKNGGGKKADLNRFHDVQVTVSAELGRINVSIHDLLDLTEGSVFELNRSISAPIELIAQGIPLGNGEVVVVDDTFAIRIKEIYATS